MIRDSCMMEIRMAANLTALEYKYTKKLIRPIKANKNNNF